MSALDARVPLDKAYARMDDRTSIDALAAVAQVEATIALAEEKRTANLIAWVHSHTSQGHQVSQERLDEIERRLS